ncbi:MAG TPA: N-acetylmuramoyl-L-alanine amidase [Methylomirabilota bacterium]|jgi:N-acetylmuramoyl-L-alanine amidase|nr:N-acetylmuramoyl-L-alanine amidase [Methylomirabilota bacterium]
MPPSDPLKRQVLLGAVRENVDTIRGLPPPPLRVGAQLRRGAIQAALLVALPTLGLLAYNPLSGSGPDRTAVLATAPGILTFRGPKAIGPVAASLSVKKVVLDPGHGGNDSGARARGVWEKEITLEIARELRAFLKRARYEVTLTRDADTFVSLRQRAQIANVERADVFVSIHVNSVPSRECHAVETYYLGPADDPRAEQLAGKENHDSGYRMADFRLLLESVYAHVRQAESRKLAQVVQQELVGVLGDTNPAIRDKGVRSAPFLVLVTTESPGILAEVSCLSNDDEAGRLADPAYRQRIARALFHGIHAYAEDRNRVATLGQAQGASR